MRANALYACIKKHWLDNMMNQNQKGQRDFFSATKMVATGRPLSLYMKIFQISHRNIKKLLHNKKLLLVGGGHSQIQRALDFAKINCDVTNVDPFINDARSARTVINQDFTNTNFENEFDEIWALYSLPLYSPDLMHAIKFYRRAAIALKPGGTLRIGGHPKWVHGALLAPVHFPRGNANFQWLDIMLEDTLVITPQHKITFDTTLHPESCHWEKWTAPKIPAAKQALNEHIQKLIQRQR